MIMHCNPMKRDLKAVCTILLLICFVVLPACSTDTDDESRLNSIGAASPTHSDAGAEDSAPASTSHNETIMVDEAVAAYQDVLLGSQNYRDAQSGEYLTINELYDVDGIYPAEPQQFVIQDLDTDGVPEVIIQMDMNGVEDFGTLILHFEDTQVAGYFMWPRAFGDLKADGTFSSSSGAFDHGYSRIDFSTFNTMADAPNNTIIHQVCYCTSSDEYDENGIPIEKYYNGGVEITAEEFEQEEEKQFAKENVSWMDFTSDNINHSMLNYG